MFSLKKMIGVMVNTRITKMGTTKSAESDREVVFQLPSVQFVM